MKISRTIRNLWREVEDILTASTGPILIMASALAAADIFSNHVFSNQYTWIPAAWAVARALAVTIWLGIAWEFYLQARRDGGGGWWLLLALALFGVDLQTALLFAIEDEHIAAVGSIPLVTIPALYWAFEQAILGVVLIAVHRSVDHQTHHAVTELAPARQVTQPGNEAPAILRGSAPTARRAYYSGVVAPILMDEEDDVGEDLGGVIELVSDERGGHGGHGGGRDDGGMTSHHRQRGPDRQPRKQRSDAGRVSEAMEQRIERLIPELLRRTRAGEKMTLDDVEIFLECSRGTASQARQRAWERIKEADQAERGRKGKQV